MDENKKSESENVVNPIDVAKVCAKYGFTYAQWRDLLDKDKKSFLKANTIGDLPR